MTQTETKPYIIDGDSHALEPPDLWDTYLEPEYRERAIRITSKPPEEVAGAEVPPGDRGEADLPEMALEFKERLAPSEHMKRNVDYVVEPPEKTIDWMMDVIGESQFIWGSDYPHIDSSIHAIDQILESPASLSEHRRKLVPGENARALYQLD